MRVGRSGGRSAALIGETRPRSADYWCRDVDRGNPGSHSLPRDGMCSIPQALANGIDIRLRHRVVHVKYAGSRGVTVTAVASSEDEDEDGATHDAEQQFDGIDAVVCTVPLGVLKVGAITFEPPLPPDKRAAISTVGVGHLSKCILCFKRPFWSSPTDPVPDLFGSVSADVSRRGEHFLFWNLHPRCVRRNGRFERAATGIQRDALTYPPHAPVYTRTCTPVFAHAHVQHRPARAGGTECRRGGHRHRGPDGRGDRGARNGFAATHIWPGMPGGTGVLCGAYSIENGAAAVAG